MAGSTPWRNGSTRARRKLNAAVLQRDGYRCMIALVGDWPVWGGRARCMGRADCVHHTRGFKVTGDDPLFMVAACTPCNLRVGEPKVDPAPQPVTEW